MTRTPLYVGELQTAELPDRRWRLLAPFGFVASRGEFIPVPPGRISNGWTVPWIFRRWYPVNRQLASAVVHDELCAEWMPNPMDSERGWVYDMSVEAVAIFAHDLPKMSAHAFDAERVALAEFRYRVDSERAAEIFQEAMTAWINPVERRVRWVVGCAVDWFGPRWHL